MKPWRRLLCLCLLISMQLCGCGNQSVSTTVDNSNANNEDKADDKVEPSTTVSQAADTVFLDKSEYFSNRDFEVGYDESESAIITLNGDSASCDSNAVQIDGTTVTIIDEGTYILSGTLNDGMIIVNAEKTDKLQLVLNGVEIHSETSAAIYVLQADKVFITTASDTNNTISNGGSFIAVDENNIDAVIFSKEDLTLNGSGTLVVTASVGHGIVSKDSLKLTSGAYDINCASHALIGKDDVCIANADITIVSGKDGIHAKNSDDTSCGYVYVQSGNFDITTEGDGISAAAYLWIEDGSFEITTGGGSENASSKSSDSWGDFRGGGRHQMGDKKLSRGAENTMAISSDKNESENEDESSSIKGIKAGMDLLIDGGTFTINSADDSFHSNASITVNGGEFTISSGDDAFHADDTLTIVDGVIQITESYEGLEALHLIISGGDITLVAKDDGLNAAGGRDASGMGGRDAMGGHGMPSSSSNGTILISGGNIYITASGDGIDANGTLEITGGHIVVCGPTKGDTSTLDFDLTGTISGGTFIGTGASAMAQTFSDSEQGVISVKVKNLSEDIIITLLDGDGNTILTHTPELSYEIVILSSPEIVSGETYHIMIGSETVDVVAS